MNFNYEHQLWVYVIHLCFSLAWKFVVKILPLISNSVYTNFKWHDIGYISWFWKFNWTMKWIHFNWRRDDFFYRKYWAIFNLMKISFLRKSRIFLSCTRLWYVWWKIFILTYVLMAQSPLLLLLLLLLIIASYGLANSLVFKW